MPFRENFKGSIIARQIDLWSLVHFFGPMLIVVLFSIILPKERDYSVIVGFCFSMLWEALDSLWCSVRPGCDLYFAAKVDKIFDKRGTSYMDQIFGIAGSMFIAPDVDENVLPSNFKRSTVALPVIVNAPVALSKTILSALLSSTS